MVQISVAKEKLDSLIKKSRVHLYKPIQIAEILYQSRLGTEGLNVASLPTYRNLSKKWRDEVCDNFIGRSSSSSQKYQDDLFNSNAIPPEVLVSLNIENINKNGIVEKYIYAQLQQRLFQINNALDYCLKCPREQFKLSQFIEGFYAESGLKRSIDKIFEIVVYALFETLITSMHVKIDVYADKDGSDIFEYFPEFCKKVLCFSSAKRVTVDAHFNRVGVTNAADRGLDMYANFGSVVQIKHLTLDEDLAQDIIGTVTSNRIIIVCKKIEEKLIRSLLNQIGWTSRIQSVITLEELNSWYDRALRGNYSSTLGNKVMSLLAREIESEFPMLGKAKQFNEFKKARGYHKIKDDNFWIL